MAAETKTKVEPRIHLIELTTREGIKSMCGSRGMPYRAEGEFGEIIVCETMIATNKFTQSEELVTCKSCLRICRLAKLRAP